jgi:hypothetical protein
LADVYDAVSLEHTFTTARTYNTYSHTFVRGILEQEGTPPAAPAVPIAVGSSVLGLAAPRVHADLAAYQHVLEAVG